MKTTFALAALAALSLPTLADGPKDNIAAEVRQVPPPGIEVPKEDRVALEEGLAELAAQIDALRPALQNDAARLALLPDIEIFHKAVHYSLHYAEFQNPKELKIARELLKLGQERAARLKAGAAPWLTQKGLVVRGFRSKIDGSVQPYGLVVPDSYSAEGAQKHRLDFWFHGRGERTTELGFINQRLRTPGQYTPKDTIVLHPYARYSNGNKFAGEIDCLEALEHVKSHYRIDPDRILVRGFSMGGAACWNFAVHYTDRWCAANPGAGYSETPEFLRTFQGETLNPTWYERKLWQLYDCTDYAVNLAQLPTVAYSGEIDRQKQAADIMAVAMEKEGLTLRHIIGPDTAHKIHPHSKVEIEKRLDSISAEGRDRTPKKIRFTTFTLRYNRMHWLTVDSLGEHWKRARLEADVTGPSKLEITRPENISGFTIDMPAGTSPFDPAAKVEVAIDASPVEGVPPVYSDRSWKAHFALRDGKWQVVERRFPKTGHVKRHGLQGPIDDAFMGSFLIVTPTGKARHEAVEKWSKSELAHAVTHWRQQFRGDARVKADVDVTGEDLASHNLILFGDPASNSILGKLTHVLPIEWLEDEIRVGDRRFPADQHALAMIYPSPLNTGRYIVLNSGFTYREYDYLNNARQVPKLPDWAVIDLTSPPTTQLPGKIPAAGFFDEQWQLRAGE